MNFRLTHKNFLKEAPWRQVFRTVHFVQKKNPEILIRIHIMATFVD